MRAIKEIAFSFMAFVLLMTILQTPELFYHINEYPIFKVFVLVSIPLILLWIVLSVKDYLRGQGVFFYVVRKFRSLSIPKAVKYVVIIVLLGNFLAVSFGKQFYPFYDVGMYRWPKEYSTRDKIVYEVKYYYWQQGEYQILELRKECISLLSEHFGWGFTNDIAYASTYFHKGEKENFEYLSHEMKERGIDTLWAGVHSFNFETNEAAFDPDLCYAVEINQSKELYYGPIYIPSYQLKKCDQGK